MRILGIDPGFRNCGYAILDFNESKKMSYVDSGVLKAGNIEGSFKKIAFFFEGAKNLIATYKPDHIALESLIYVKSPTALIKLAHARGSMLAAFTMTHCDSIYEYSPNEVKLFATGHGHSTKKNIQYLVGQQTGKKDFHTSDESDAIAVALCHSLRCNTFNNKISLISSKKERSGISLKNALGHLIKTE